VTPIVFVNAIDPIGAGLVASFARPGGNTTGFASTNLAWRRNGWRYSRRSWEKSDVLRSFVIPLYLLARPLLGQSEGRFDLYVAMNGRFDWHDPE
jgi:hypothetical protein